MITLDTIVRALLGVLNHGRRQGANMVLAAWDRGVGAVINGQGSMQSSVVREHACIPDHQLIVITVAMGYPAEFPANDVVSERRSVAEIATYRGFE